ncbi:DUF917 domain-containing protein [Deinococcus sp. UYEF24]
MSWIHAEDLPDIAFGAAVLGTGGGGDPHIGQLMAAASIRRNGPVELIRLEDLHDDDLVVPVGMMGAPTVMLEKLPSGQEALLALQTLETHLGRKVRALLSVEAGGLNSTIPIGVASELGLPLVDADGMGRAFPELQMVVMTLHGVSATPMGMADEKGNAALLRTIDNRWTERLARTITIEMGGSSLTALYPMSGKQAKVATIPGTITLLADIGRAAREARQAHGDPVEAVRAVTHGFYLFKGKVRDVERRTVGGFARGVAVIEGLDTCAGQQCRLEFQNENLIATCDGEVLASVPDLITALDAESGEPITTETLRYGMRVVVIAMPCDPQWRSPAGLALVGPGYFGYDVPFVPVETRFPAQSVGIELVGAS